MATYHHHYHHHYSSSPASSSSSSSSKAPQLRFTSKGRLSCGLMLLIIFTLLLSLTIVPMLDDLDLPLTHRLHDRHRQYAIHDHQHFPLEEIGTANTSNITVPDFSEMAAEILPETIWSSPLAKLYHGCSRPNKSFPNRVSAIESNGYIYVETSGGLNQQRIGITDAVVVARILNATLIVPVLDHDSFWKDNSNFSDIFDIEWFIATLAPDVQILKEVPSRLRITREMLYSTRAPRKSEPEYYIRNILPHLRRKKAIRLTKFDYRLASELEEGFQKLRCRVNYQSLRFTTAIANMGKNIVKRLKTKGGRYIALHLRFEPDMLAFTGCYYGGGEKERRELGEIRKRWITLSPMKQGEVPRSGKCPLTPEEVGLMLRALGFENNSHIYVASGEVYGGEDNLAPLRAIFPNFHTKDSLTSYEELGPFMPYTNRMAAIDYIVCEESDVFITNYNGNMVKILAGSRRYRAHKRTIQPNVKKLGSLFSSRRNITWKAFTKKLRRIQRGYIGEPDEKRPGGDFFEFPSSCICKSNEENLTNPLLTNPIEDLLYRQASRGQSEMEILSKSDLVEFRKDDTQDLQQADLLRETNASVQSENKDLDEVSWFSD